MTIETVIRNSDGDVINIGPWDDLGGRNPLPLGTTSVQEDVTTNSNGDRYITSEAPPIEKKALTAEELATFLISKGVITIEEITTIKRQR